MGWIRRRVLGHRLRMPFSSLMWASMERVTGTPCRNTQVFFVAAKAAAYGGQTICVQISRREPFLQMKNAPSLTSIPSSETNGLAWLPRYVLHPHASSFLALFLHNPSHQQTLNIQHMNSPPPLHHHHHHQEQQHHHCLVLQIKLIWTSFAWNWNVMIVARAHRQWNQELLEHSHQAKTASRLTSLPIGHAKACVIICATPILLWARRW